jgi:hypothetical protein
MVVPTVYVPSPKVTNWVLGAVVVGAAAVAGAATVVGATTVVGAAAEVVTVTVVALFPPPQPAQAKAHHAPTATATKTERFTVTPELACGPNHRERPFARQHNPHVGGE